MANVFSAIAEKIMNGSFTGAISGYQTEREQKIMYVISYGWQVEDEAGTYDDEDRAVSAAGSVEHIFNSDEAAASEYLKTL